MIEAHLLSSLEQRKYFQEIQRDSSLVVGGTGLKVAILRDRDRYKSKVCGLSAWVDFKCHKLPVDSAL